MFDESYKAAEYEMGEINNLFASGKTARQGFIRKVFVIFATQIGFSFVMILFAIFNKDYRMFYATHFWLNILAMILLVVISIVLYCTHISRKVDLSGTTQLHSARSVHLS